MMTVSSAALLQWQVVTVQNEGGGGVVYGFFSFSKYWIFCKADDIVSCFLMLCYVACRKRMHLRID